MKKKLMLMAMLILTVFTLSSCTLLLEQLRGQLTGYNSDMSYNYTESDETKLRENMESALTLVREDENYKDFNDKFYSVMIDLVKVATYSSIAHIKYCETGEEKFNDDYNRFSDIFDDLIKWRQEVATLVNGSSFREQFINDYTEETLNSLLENKMPDEYYTLNKSNSEIIDQFNRIDNPDQASIKDLYIKMIENNNKLAKLFNYDTYMDYANDNVYGREYDAKTTSEFTKYVKQYLVPIYLSMNSTFKTTLNEVKNSDKTSYNEFANFVAGSYKNYNSIIKEYTTDVDKNFGSVFTSTMKSNYATFGNYEKSYDGAFTTYLYGYGNPAMYFGPNYQNSLTVLHEYGHYYSAYQNKGMTNDLDLSEIQSQGNEMLFLAYLNNINYFTQKVEDLVIEYSMLDAFWSIIQCSIIFDFENASHNLTDFTNVDFDALYIEICNKYGGYEVLKANLNSDPINYWHRVVIPHSGYYISYAISQVPAVELYCQSITNFSKGVVNYLSLSGESELGLQEALADTSLFYPFDEQAFILIDSVF